MKPGNVLSVSHTGTQQVGCTVPGSPFEVSSLADLRRPTASLPLCPYRAVTCVCLSQPHLFPPWTPDPTGAHLPEEEGKEGGVPGAGRECPKEEVCGALWVRRRGGTTRPVGYSFSEQTEVATSVLFSSSHSSWMLSASARRARAGGGTVCLSVCLSVSLSLSQPLSGSPATHTAWYSASEPSSHCPPVCCIHPFSPNPITTSAHLWALPAPLHSLFSYWNPICSAVLLCYVPGTHY